MADRRIASAGPAPQSVRDRRAVVAVDLGGTTIKAGLIGPSGLHVLERTATGRERGFDAVLADVSACALSLADRAAAMDLDVIATGVSVPGVVDERRGVGVMSVTFGWRDLALGDLLEAQMSAQVPTPVAVRHDVRSAARAEAAFGKAAGSTIALFLAIGTGLAASVVLDGRVLDGASHQAGEVGQLLIADPDRGAADDGASGEVAHVVTLEAVASARGIAERYAALAHRSNESIDAAQVVHLAGNGDAIATRVWTDAVDALADALAGSVITVDPDVIVLGGGVSRAGDLLVGPLRAAMAVRLPWRPVPRIEVGGFGEDAGFVGTALAAWEVADATGIAALGPVLDAATWPANRDRLSSQEVAS